MPPLQRSSLTNQDNLAPSAPTAVSLTAAQNRFYQFLLREVLPDEHGRRLTANLYGIAGKDRAYISTLKTYRLISLLDGGIYEVHERSVEVRYAPGQKVESLVREITSRLEVASASTLKV